MADLVIAMYADLGATLPATAFATDAMGANDQDAGGFGIVAADCDPADIRRCFEECLEPGFTVVRLDGHFEGLKNPSSKIGRNIPFTKVPEGLLQADWRPMMRGRWQSEDHITLGEGRAVVRLLDLIASNSRCHRRRVLSLQDNRPVVGAMAKGRSPTGPPEQTMQATGGYHGGFRNTIAAALGAVSGYAR